MKKDYPTPNILEGNTNVVSSTEYTGLIPATPEDDSELKAYSELYPSHPKIKPSNP